MDQINISSATPNIPKPIFVIANNPPNANIIHFDYFHNGGEIVLVCGTDDGDVLMLSLETRRCLFQFNIKNFNLIDENIKIQTVIYINSNQKFFVHLSSGDLYLFHLKNQQKQEQPTLITRWKTQQITFSKCSLLNDKYLIFLNQNDSTQFDLCHYDNPNKIVSIKTSENHGTVISTLPFLINTSLIIISAFEDGYLTINKCPNSLEETFATKTTKNDASLITSVKLHSDMITCIDFNLKTLRGISCGVPDQITIWSLNEDLLSFKQHKTITSRSEGLLCCTIRPDGRIFAVGCKDGRIRVFGTKSGKPLAVMTYHTDAIETIRFVPKNGDTYLLIACSRDKIISIWSIY